MTRLDGRFLQIISPNRRMDAVYRNDDGSIFRCPVVALALREYVEGVGSGHPELAREIVPITWVDWDKSFDWETEPITEVKNFLGLEFDGKERAWPLR